MWRRGLVRGSRCFRRGGFREVGGPEGGDVSGVGGWGGGRAEMRTSMMGSWPLTPTLRYVFFMSTTMSLPLRFAGTDTVMSRSCIVCVHL